MASINRRWLLLQRQKLALISMLLLRHRRRYVATRKRKSWMRKLFQERRSKGLYNMLVKDLMLFDDLYFFKAFKMSTTRFEELLSWVAPFVLKSTNIRDTTGPSERLCITLWYLSNGDAQLSIASSFRVSPPTVSRIISETCSVIWDELCSRGFLKVPNTELK